MADTERMTVSLPGGVVRKIDRLEKNRSRFILDAVRRELRRRQRSELRRSLARPHPESRELADAGLDSWVLELPEEDTCGLVDVKSGTAVRWVPGRGWKEERGSRRDGRHR